eukprot:m.233358 g.233358  ORF g.233358 m.233358 type:complete len:148 (+) comp19077_c0_seq1:60-503(+)
MAEDVLAAGRSSAEDGKFDTIIGHLEDILIGSEFQTLLDHFMSQYAGEFEDSEENKFIYTDIFKKYTTMIEAFIDRALQARIRGFRMADFLKMLPARAGQISEEIMDLLHSFGDFLTFKEAMLDYKKSRAAAAAGDFGLSLVGQPFH